MPKFRKSKEALEVELKEQMEALRYCAASFDGGNLWQAKFLSVTMYNLLFDGSGLTKSLLTTLQIRSKVNFLSTMEPIPISLSGVAPTLTNATPLLVMKIEGGSVSFQPAFHLKNDLDKFSWLSFDDWWSENILWTPQIVLSRKRLLLTMRTQDGGSHVDDHIRDEDYWKLLTAGDPMFRVVKNFGGIRVGGDTTNSTAIPDGPKVLIRQIAWEVEHSLSKLGY